MAILRWPDSTVPWREQVWRLWLECLPIIMLHISCKRVLRTHDDNNFDINCCFFFLRLVCCVYKGMYYCMRRLGYCFTGNRSPPMPMVLPEIFKESPDSDIDRFLTHLDLCLKNQKCKKVDILMTLLDEWPRSILNDPVIICHTQPPSIDLLATKISNVR